LVWGGEEKDQELADGLEIKGGGIKSSWTRRKQRMILLVEVHRGGGKKGAGAPRPSEGGLAVER